MDDEDIHDRLERLEATVADQQQTIEQLTEPPAVGRRGVLASLLGAGAVGGLAGYGSQSARAQASGPAGQVGTGEEPVDVEAWNLTVQNEADGVGGVENPLTETLEADGNDVTGVGALEVDALSITNVVDEWNVIAEGVSDIQAGGSEVVVSSYSETGTVFGFAHARGDETDEEWFVIGGSRDGDISVIVRPEGDGTGINVFIPNDGSSDITVRYIVLEWVAP